MIVTFDHVTYRYARDEAPALRDLTLTLDTARLIGICGRTGSGKSTFMQHLNGILKPTAGRVLIDGEDLHAVKHAVQRVRQRVGMSFQFPERQLFGRTVWEELTYTLNYHQVPAAEQERRVAEVCAWLDIDLARQRDRSPFGLSRSAQRKLGIAVVLALQPEIVVLDEPTAGLDRAQSYRLLDTLHRLHHQGQCQVMLVSHDVELLLEYAEVLVVFAAGAIGWEGTPETLLDSPQGSGASGLIVPEAYRRIWQMGGRQPNRPPAERSLHALLQRFRRAPEQFSGEDCRDPAWV